MPTFRLSLFPKPALSTVFATKKRLAALSVAFFVLVLLTSVSGFAQVVSYKPWPIDEALADSKTAVFASVERGTIDAAARDFFQKYYFARWTDKAKEGQLAAFQSDLLRNDIRRLSGASRNTFLKTAMDELVRMAGDKTVFPAARYNAVLAVGLLVSREGSGTGSNATLPVPYPDALPYLVSQYRVEDNPQYLRFGALLGVVRHAQLGIEDQSQRNDVFTLLCDIIRKGQPSADVSKEEQEILDWQRIRAMEGLTNLAMLGPGGEAVTVLLAVAGSPNEAPEIRYLALRALGDLDYTTAGANLTVPFSRIVEVVGVIALAACENEIKWIQDQRFKDPTMRSSMAAMSSSMSPMSSPSYSEGSSYSSAGGPGMMGAKGEEQAKQSLQRVKFAFSCIRNVIGGAASRFESRPNATGIKDLVTQDEDKSKLTQTETAIRAMFTELEELTVPADKRKGGDKRKPTARGPGGMSGSEMSGYPGEMGAAQASSDLTLPAIEEALKELTTKLNQIYK